MQVREHQPFITELVIVIFFFLSASLFAAENLTSSIESYVNLNDPSGWEAEVHRHREGDNTKK